MKAKSTGVYYWIGPVLSSCFLGIAPWSAKDEVKNQAIKAVEEQ